MQPSSGPVGNVPSISPQTLANLTAKVLSEEESFLRVKPRNRSVRQYRECDVQFLLWRKLLSLGYDAWVEDEHTDISIRDGSTLAAAIELKGPWRTRDFPIDVREACSQDFRKHLQQLSSHPQVQCYSLWLLHGPDEKSIQEGFGLLFQHASSGVGGRCRFDQTLSELVSLNPHPETDSRFLRAYVVQVSGANPPSQS